MTRPDDALAQGITWEVAADVTPGEEQPEPNPEVHEDEEQVL